MSMTSYFTIFIDYCIYTALTCFQRTLCLITVATLNKDLEYNSTSSIERSRALYHHYTASLTISDSGCVAKDLNGLVTLILKREFIGKRHLTLGKMVCFWFFSCSFWFFKGFDIIEIDIERYSESIPNRQRNKVVLC